MTTDAAVMNGAAPAPNVMKAIGIGTPILIITLLAMMILPLPPLALDVLFTFNIALSLVVLLAALLAMLLTLPLVELLMGLRARRARTLSTRPMQHRRLAY